MIKCHWTDHNHAFFKSNSGQFYECEYCDKVKISSYSVWQLLKDYEELTRHMSFSDTAMVEMAVVQYLWDRSEESRTAGIPPGAALLALAIHMSQSGSTIVYSGQQPVSYQIGCPVTAPSAGTSQSPSCIQSQPRRPADYYSDLNEEEKARELISLVRKYYSQTRIVPDRPAAVTIALPLECAGISSDQQGHLEQKQSSPTQSSIDRPDPDKP